MKKLLILLMAGLLTGSPARGSVPEQGETKYRATPKVPIKVYAFSLNDVRLLDGPFKRVPRKTLQFKTVGVGRPNDVSLIPFYQAHHQRFTVYWDLLTEKNWQQKQAEHEAQQRRSELLQARTVDEVVPEAQPERAHNYQGEKSSAGAFNGRRWRHAYSGGWFSYEMKIAPDRRVDLMVTYWGSDTGSRTFDVMIDGRKIATQTLNMNQPDEFFDVTYPIPEELGKNKDKVTVRFQSHSGTMAGGVFGCRIVKRSSSVR